MTVRQWDREVDVIVIGAGAAGMSAALTANIEGLSVLILEKTDRIGGSTAISGGVVWAPANSKAAATGHSDSHEQALAYLAATVGDTTPAALQRCFVEASGAMVDYFEKHTSVKFSARQLAPDYFPERAGATSGGRALDPVEFDARALARHFAELREPLPQFLVLGGMMINTADVFHLLGITRSFRSLQHGLRIVLRYFSDRLRGYRRGTRLLLGNALAARLFHSIIQRNIEYWLCAEVQQLYRDSQRVCGIGVQYEGLEFNIRARRGVVIATGGFPWHAEMRERLYPKPTGPWSMAPISNCGEGVQLAQRVGAVLGRGHVSPALWAPVSLHRSKNGTTVRYPHLIWERAKPGLMAVNGSGRRFVDEATSYHEFVLAMYRSHENVPTIPAYLICDDDFIRKWGLGLALPGGRPRDHLLRDGYLYRAASLRELAQHLNVDADALESSAAQFNAAADNGIDESFGKGGNAYDRSLGDPHHRPNPCLGPLRKSPFYAVAVYPGDIGTAAGIRCNEQTQALDVQDQPIQGLYVAGNDMHSVMGGHYPAAGITLGPALTFGWLAGMHLASPSTLLAAASCDKPPATCSTL